MPIGKNAIKRVSKNGYSNVKTSAPDMENSVVIEEKAVVDEKKIVAIEEKKPATKKATEAKNATPKKATTKKAPVAPKKSMETEPELSPIKTAEKVTKKSTKAPQRQGNGYVNLGGELPYYLL